MKYVSCEIELTLIAAHQICAQCGEPAAVHRNWKHRNQQREHSVGEMEHHFAEKLAAAFHLKYATPAMGFDHVVYTLRTEIAASMLENRSAHQRLEEMLYGTDPRQTETRLRAHSKASEEE